MTARRATLLALAAVLFFGIVAWLSLQHPAVDAAPPAITKRAATRSAASSADTQSTVQQPPAALPAEPAAHLADDLNAPAGTIRRDLEILNEVFATSWQTNFPHDGNPVGENAEITTALTGANPVHFAFIPKNHRAINDRGELCDRWGMPFFFHQLSGTQMEIRSAGPDEKFGSADDVEFAPWPK